MARAKFSLELSCFRLSGVGRRKASKMTQLTTVLNCVYLVTSLPIAIMLLVEGDVVLNVYR